MTFRVVMRAGLCTLLLGFGLASIAGPAGAAKKTAKKSAPKPAKEAAAPVPVESLFGVTLPDPAGAAGFLPDSFVIARVANQPLRVGEYVRTYFNALGEVRPSQDSLGRVEFLRQLIAKELMAAEARRINRPMGFEDRQKLREHANRVYSNVLYQRTVIDPVQVGDAQVRAAYELYKFEVRLRHLVFADRAVGERVRRDLLAGRIGWSTAVKRYSVAEDRAQNGELGWQTAANVGLDFARRTHVLKSGEMSPLIQTRAGWDLVQCVERREVSAPEFNALESMIRAELQAVDSDNLADALQDTIAAEIGAEVDSANVGWAAGFFKAATSVESDGRTPVINIEATLPEFAPEDTGRVLVRYRGGQLSLGGFLEAYSHIAPVLRPNINDYWLLRSQAIATALDPFTTAVAIRRGMDKDPDAVRMVERKREEILVEHLYEDSVASRLWIPAEDRRRYYEENKHYYITWVKVRFAAITRPSRAGIDSVEARIRAGESAAAILRADSLAGRASGSVQERSEADKGSPYHKLLMEELRPGGLTVVGPDREGDFLLLQVLDREDGRQLSFDEASTMVDETLQSLQAEERLNHLLVRLARAYRVDWRPDLVMRAEFKPPVS